MFCLLGRGMKTVVLYVLVGVFDVELMRAKLIAIIASFSVSYVARKRLMAG